MKLRAALGRTGRALAAAPLRRVALALALLLPALAGLGVASNRLVGRVVGQRVGDELANTLTTSVAGLDAWLDETGRMAVAAREDDRVTTAARQGAGLAEALAPYLRAGSFSGFALFDSTPEVLASGGTLAGVRANMAARVGPAGFVPPTLIAPRHALPLMRVSLAADRGPLTLLLAIPLEHFTGVLHLARAGRTGETYAVDRDGLMLSDTRFAPHLVAAGLLAPAASAALAVAVRDPGVDLTTGARAPTPRAEQPLTAMAQSLVRGGAGVDVRGYRDYRGVEVVGAWRWLSHGFGVVTELDRAEAFRSLATLERLFAGLFVVVGFSAAGLVLLGLVARRLQARARAAERQIQALGQYNIVRKLGEGGMGSVYLGTHALLRRPTAIKLLRPDDEGVGSVARFEREVRATSELRHPNTIAIYDYGRTPDGILYYAMEYLEGASMETLVRTHGPLPAERVIYLLRQACASLAEAHARGVIHRDVKPANIWVCDTRGVADLVKVLDFGLARWQAEPEPGAAAAVRGYELDLVLGTPAYMAPERFESATAAGPQSDVYALGAVGYFLCTGTPVFADRSLAALAAAHLSRPPVPPSLRLGRSIDRTLEHAISSCLAKHPEHRPAGPAGLAWLLDASPVAQLWTPADAEAWWGARARPRETTPAPADRGSPAVAIPRHA